jgi:hypothetical protein
MQKRECGFSHSMNPLGEEPAGGLGVGEAVAPPPAFALCDEHEKTPPEGGVFSVLLERLFVVLANIRSDFSERIG